MSELRAARQMSLLVLPVAVGACGASLQSICALQAPRYASAMRQYGISFVRSPRHADVVLVAGALTRGALGQVRRLLAGVPQPRAIIAVGNCAIDGCIFQGSPRLVVNAAAKLGANVEIAGCPPGPEAILSSIITARRLLAGEETTGAEDMGSNNDSNVREGSGETRVSASGGDEEGKA
jgi:Ni,Fe-hydrogenase III small subunit